MKRPAPGRRGAGDGSSYQDTAPVMACPVCKKPHRKPPLLVARFISDELTMSVLYGLCDRCAEVMGRAGHGKRKRLAARIERNLEALGAFEGIRRAVQA